MFHFKQAGLHCLKLWKESMTDIKFGTDGWLLIRFSGTEPLIRVYTETTDQDAVQAIQADGKTLAGL